MKLTLKYLMVAFVLTFIFQNGVHATELEGFDVIKGQVYDLDGDNKWDLLTFQVITKSANYDIPVKSIRLIENKSGDAVLVNFRMIEINKRIDDYYVDLTSLKANNNFSIEIVFDTTALSGFSSQITIDGGPGSNPNETVLVIDYP